MYTLKWHPKSASLAPMAVLEEIGAPYEARLVEIAACPVFGPLHDPVDLRARVPALMLPNGRTVFEAAAIVTYLADAHASGRLVPAVSRPERAEYYDWLLFLTATLCSSYDRLYRAERFVEVQTDVPKLRTNVRRHLAAHWMAAEAAVAGRRWLVGDRFTAADIYLTMIVSWDDDTVFEDRYPTITRIAAAVRGRPAVARAFARHMARSGE